MIKHIVLARFKQGVTKEQISEMRKLLAALPAVIPEIKSYDFGQDVRPGKTFDFILVSEFSDPKAVERYRIQPDHAAAAKYIRNLSEDLQIVDFEF
jgi:hypothetical protein